MKKDFLLDTNVLIHDSNFAQNFEENNIIIPLICIEELDSLKTRDGIVGYQARTALREIDNLRLKYGNLYKGIELPSGGTLRVEINHMDLSVLPDGMDRNKNDNKILAIFLNLNKIAINKMILVTKDLNMSIKADSLGIEVEDYKSDKVDVDNLYSGFVQITLNSEQINQIFNGGLKLPDKIFSTLKGKIFPNCFFQVHNYEDDSNEALVKYDGIKLIPLEHEMRSAFGMSPLNREQLMAFELLMDPKIQLCTISGGAGSGKTFLSVACALEQVIELGIYRKIVFVRPVVPAGNDIGFLPGSEDEKLKPWMGPFYDAIENLFNNGYKKSTSKKNKDDKFGNETVDSFIDMFRDEGIIETKTFNYMRGRTLSDALVIVDESQQITPQLAKLMLTRAGKDAKFVFTGDPSDNQIDTITVNSKSNGLVYIIDKMKPFEITGHVTLQQVERSPLAELAEKYL